MSLYMMLLGVALFALLAGLARRQLLVLPIVAAGSLVIAYATLLLVLGVRAAGCWQCPGAGHDATRGSELTFGALFYGIALSITLAAIWIGAWLARRWQR